MSTPHVLIVDDEANVRTVLGALIEQAGLSAGKAASAEEALQLVRAQDPDLVLTDLQMPGMDGLALLRELRRAFPEIPVVMLTAHGTVDAAVEAMKLGAHDFLSKPFDKEHVLAVVRGALGEGTRRRADFQGPLVPGARCGMVGSSIAMLELQELVERVAPSPTTVLVTGETGTGKELVASAIHQLSPRRDAPFVPINCGALPETLVESELFGHEKGAFTGADRGRPGRFELADGGTLFLDEVGELPAAAQVKLLRVVQDGVVQRLGGTDSRAVGVRLVAATHRDLDAEVSEGRFREDLLYRLRVIELRVPPLRERLDDLPALLELFLAKHARRLDRPEPALSEGVVAALSRREWPGNVRELENAVERAVLLARGDRLDADDFGAGPVGHRPGTSTCVESGSEAELGHSAGDLKAASREAAARVEQRMIRAALESTGGNVTHAAERLGISRRGLQVKMKELRLDDATG